MVLKHYIMYVIDNKNGVRKELQFILFVEEKSLVNRSINKYSKPIKEDFLFLEGKSDTDTFVHIWASLVMSLTGRTCPCTATPASLIELQTSIFYKNLT